LEVLFLLMSGGLSGAYDATNIFVWRDGYDEQDLSSIHAETLKSLLVIIEPVVELFDLAGILESPRRGCKADAVLGEIRRCFGFVPFIFHAQSTTGYRY
jgi:hypothetical protein